MFIVLLISTNKHIILQLLAFWTLPTILFLIFRNNISETGFCLRLQVKPTQLGPLDRTSPYLRTAVPTQDRIYKSKATKIISGS
jgi:hypothetical protein